jgi:hypothetical protein
MFVVLDQAMLLVAACWMCGPRNNQHHDEGVSIEFGKMKN